MKKVAGKWEKVRRTVYPFEQVLGHYQVMVAKNFCKGHSLLDLGCGEGAITSQLRDNFTRIVGVDGTKSQIILGRKKFPFIEFVHSTIEEFVPKEKFDCILLFFILEHVDSPSSILKIAKKWLKKGGSIHIQVPNKSSLNRRIGTKMGLLENESALHAHDKESGHQRMFDLKSITQLVKRNNLKIVDKGGFFLKTHPNHQMQILYDTDMWENKSIKKKYFDGLFEIGKEIPEYASTLFIHCKKV